ncbi:MAG: trigger factor [Lachnospiraceae bacterium]|nr:trigger factor [Lachnospiraceae bacterium]
MKKRIIILLAALCAASLIGGCGTKKENNKQENNTQESTQESDSGESTDQISYNAEECVELGEYMGVELTLGTYEVTEEEIQSNIDSMLTSYPKYEESDKTTVEEGDTVNIDYEGLKDDVAFDGGTAQDSYLEIGSGSFIDGFEDGLIGKKVGEKVKLNLTFPENYQNTELAGQDVVFNVTINKIVNKEIVTHETVADDFVASNFTSQGYKNVKELEAGVKEQLESSKETSKKTDTQNALFEKLRESCKVTLPEGLLDQKVKEYIDQFTTNMETSYGMKLEDYLSSINTTEDEFKQQAEQMMTDSLENQIILEAIAQKENIEADEEGYAEYKKNVVTDFGFESEDALIQQYGEDYVKNAYVSDKTMDILIENAKITYEDQKDSDQQGESTDEEESGDKADASDKAESAENTDSEESE